MGRRIVFRVIVEARVNASPPALGREPRAPPRSFDRDARRFRSSTDEETSERHWIQPLTRVLLAGEWSACAARRWHVIKALLTVPNAFVARGAEFLDRQVFVGAFVFLEAHRVGRLLLCFIAMRAFGLTG